MSKQKGVRVKASTKNLTQSNKTNSEWSSYLDLQSFQLAPANKDVKKRIFMELYIWSHENDRAYTIKQFFKMKKMDPFCVYPWMEKEPELQTIYKATISNLAARREEKGLERSLDPMLVRHTMPMYDDEWKKLEEWRSKLSDGQANSGTKIVVIEKFGEEKK